VRGVSLAELLRAHRDEIVAAWELRAREIAAGRLLSGPALRDHVREADQLRRLHPADGTAVAPSASPPPSSPTGAPR
jgi:hypothetical protein